MLIQAHNKLELDVDHDHKMLEYERPTIGHGESRYDANNLLVHQTPYRN
jgi:hypothetical protein